MMEKYRKTRDYYNFPSESDLNSGVYESRSKLLFDLLIQFVGFFSTIILLPRIDIFGMEILPPRYELWIVIVLIVPFVEEFVKLFFLLFVRINPKNVRLSFLHIFVFSYFFQVVEAFILDDVVSIRLLLPLHFVFTFVTIRYGFRWGLLLHSVWNAQFFYFDNSTMYFGILYYVIFFLAVYVHQVRLRYVIVMINNKNGSHNA